jgi:hypothetical protein
LTKIRTLVNLLFTTNAAQQFLAVVMFREAYARRARGAICHNRTMSVRAGFAVTMPGTKLEQVLFAL